MKEAPNELQMRLALLSQEAEQGADFDAVSWFWLLLLGLVGPVALIILGWNA